MREKEKILKHLLFMNNIKYRMLKAKISKNEIIYLNHL